ncbi:tetratricopeptide repeat protein [Microbulbifer sp. SAOS-129_SWC]|uniref:tetratricopeptide repeat protein n=1 Tax=Microbulbifer sp. SAOS-129_SWC TaxID=3145235 RepID=UPI0032178543
MGFRSLSFRSVITLLSFTLMTLSSPQSHASSDFEKTYYRLEANVFDHQLLREVATELKAPLAQRRDDPWVYLCASLATLVAGYDIGDWYSAGSFVPGTVERALQLAGRARSLAPGLSQAQAHYARVLIVEGKYKLAWEVLNKAHDLDAKSFYPWYFRGIVAEKMRDAQRASAYFDEAGQRVVLAHQRNLLNIHRQKVARLTRDFSGQERLLRENIDKNPGTAIYYGNYAQFLMAHKRYAEARTYWEKAVAINPYPHALKKLAEVNRLLAAEPARR